MLEQYLHACERNAYKRACMLLYLAKACKTVQNFRVMKKMKVAQEGPVYTTNVFLHFWSDMGMHASTMRINVHAHFYIWQLLFNSAEFGGDEENESCPGGSNV